MKRTLKRFASGLIGVWSLVSSVQAERLVANNCEGTVNFGNTTSSSITNFFTQTRLPAGTNFLVSLLYLPDIGVVPTDGDFDQARVLLPNAAIGPVPGVFVGGTRSTPTTTPGGATAWFQVRVWESVFGTNVFGSFAEASAAREPVGGRLPLLGLSAIVKVRTGGPCGVPPGVPASLRLHGFYVGNEGAEDHRPPVIQCPSLVEGILFPGQTTVAVSFTIPASDDPNPPPTVVCTPSSGSQFKLGLTYVTCSATDLSGNRDQCTFPVSVTAGSDTTPPVVTCPGDLTSTVTSSQQSRVVNFVAAAQDNLDPAPVVTCIPNSGWSFPVGSTLVTCTATDFSGNRGQCLFQVVVNVVPDTAPPILHCPANISLTVPASQVPRAINFTVTAQDDFDPSPMVSCSPPSGFRFPQGVTSVSCDATDHSGNHSDCGFTVTITTTPDCASGTAGGSVTFANTASSAVTNQLTLNRVPAGANFLAALYYLPDSGQTPTAADFDNATTLLPAVGFGPGAGIFSGSTRITPPTTPGGSTAWFQVRVWESVFGTKVFASYEEAKAARDQVGGRLPLLGLSRIMKVQTGNPCSVPPGVPASLPLSGFMVGTHPSEDHVPPTVICPADITATSHPRAGPQVVHFTPSAYDDLDPAPVMTCTPASGFAFPEGPTSVKCMARDWNGNSSQCGFTVTVEVEPDTTPPVLSCPTNLTVGVARGRLTRAARFVVHAIDDVDPAPAVACQPPSGGLFPLGETLVTCTATDFSTNSAQCFFTVTLMEVDDHTAPVLSCVDHQAYTTGSSTVVEFAPSVTDDVDPEPVVTCDPPSGSSFPLGLTYVTCVARDQSDNNGSCAFKVTVSISLTGGGGTVNFGNNGATAITNSLTGQRIPAGTDFLVSLYFLPYRDTTPADRDFDYGVLLRTTGFWPVAGLFTGGTAMTPAFPGAPAWFQVRIWESVFGTNRFATFEEARATRTPVDGRLPLLQILAPVRVTTGNPGGSPPGTPGGLVSGGLKAFPVTTETICAPPPPGLVGWWTFDGHLDNLGGTAPGVLKGARFVAGQVGQAVRCDSPHCGIGLPDTASLTLQNFTIEAWIRRASPVQVTPDGTAPGYLFASFTGGYGFGIEEDGHLSLGRIGAERIRSLAAVTDTAFHHVAVMKQGGVVWFFLDGVGEVVEPFDAVFSFNGPMAIGAQGGSFSNTFWGTIDEMSLYNRALTEDELRAVAGANLGKCVVGIPPATAVEPASQTACRGDRVVLAVAAAGSAPLRYQWMFENAPIAGAHGAELRLDEVAAAAAGHYAVVFTNAYGAATSQVAVVTVASGAPIVTLTGARVWTLECQKLFVDPGATALDACGSRLPVEVAGVIDANVPGSYTVRYRATDRWGQSGTAERTVRVADTALPSIQSCPGPMDLELTSAEGAAALWPAPSASDACAGPLPVQCRPDSGSLFPVGTTTVTCTAADPSGNTASCSFVVTVLGVRTTLQGSQEELEELQAGTMTSKDRARLGEAVDHLTEALAPTRWLDENHLQGKSGQHVFEALQKAVRPLDEVRRDKRSEVSDAAIERLMRRLAEAARMIVVIQLQDAIARGGNPKKLGSDWDEVARGDQEMERGKFAEAIEHYRHAWRQVAHLVVKLMPHAEGALVRVEFLAVPREAYIIEATSDVVSWSTLGLRTADAEGVVVWEEPLNAQPEQRFYRARVVK